MSEEQDMLSETVDVKANSGEKKDCQRMNALHLK